MIELLGWIFLGCALGIFTGCVPGIHVNTVAAFAILMFPAGGIEKAVAIASMCVVHSFVDFVPSVLLGAPDSEGFVAMLPGHALVLKGEGIYAIKLTALGGLLGAGVALLAVPFFALFLGGAVSAINPLIGVAIAALLLAMPLTEKKGGRRWAFVAVGLGSALGLVVLGRGNSMQSLAPLVGGLFGASTVLYSLKGKFELPAQSLEASSYPKGAVGKGTLVGAIAGGVVSVLPSLGAAQAAFIVGRAIGNMTRSTYLVTVGAINTCNAMLSMAVLWVLGKTRTGAAVAVKEMVEPGSNEFVLLVLAMVASAGIGFFAAEFSAKKILGVMHRVPYKATNIAVLAVLTGISVLLGGVYGLAVFGVAACIGLVPLVSGIRRTHSMAFLMAPTALFYLFG